MIETFLAAAKDKAVAREFDVVGLLHAIERLAAAGATAQVVDLYRTWIDANADNPQSFAVCFNLGVVLSAANDLEGAASAFAEAIRLNPGFAPPYINLGSVHEKLGRVDQALSLWQSLLNALTAVNGDALAYKTMALKQSARVLEANNSDGNAEEALRQHIAIDPHKRDIVQHWLNLRQKQCKWPVVAPIGELDAKAMIKAMSPLSMAAFTDDPLLQLASAYAYATEDVGRPNPAPVGPWLAPDHRKRDSLRVGYLSSDLRGHAVGYLTTEMFELHDRRRIEVFVYYCGPQIIDEINIRIRSSVDQWRDINALGDSQAAALIVGDEIDILIDLNGNTMFARTKIFAYRPAPIIVNWLGFPCTMGSPYHHYIIADEFVIPKESEIYYSEKVLRLPCYQPNDRKRVIAPVRPSRLDAGLPEDAVVYCCFNALQKVTSFTFRRWLGILQQVPHSVLWLLDGGVEANDRLRHFAAANSISSDRIIFAAKKPHPDHLARYPLADLFLDTSPYGAHTTASDALWMGVPILTAPGRSFASRVCASLVSAAGMDELICDSFDAYVARAVELGLDARKLQGLKDKMAENRDNCTLFNTPLLVSSLEQLYFRIWNDFIGKKLPIPDLRNMDIYHDIGSAIDHEREELAAREDYRDLYKRMISYQHNYAGVAPDQRIWSAPE